MRLSPQRLESGHHRHSSAKRPPPRFQMQMVLVRGVIVGAQHGAEHLTALVADALQEPRLRSVAIPVLLDHHPRAVAQHHPRDIDGRRARMGAGPRAGFEA